MINKKNTLFIFDGFNTLYDESYIITNEICNLIKKLPGSQLIFSNIGSINGEYLEKKLLNTSNLKFHTTLTSLDLTKKLIKKKNFKKCYIYGSKKSKSFLSSELEITDIKHADALILTSLEIESSLIKIGSMLNDLSMNPIPIILSNPDRIPPIGKKKLTIAMIFDLIVSQLKSINIQLETIEIGKPNISREELNISEETRIINFGDNYDTDGKLSKNLNAQFIPCSFLSNIEHPKSSKLDWEKRIVYNLKSSLEYVIN